MKILLLGKDGQVGHALQGALASLGQVISCGRQEADLADLDVLARLVRQHAPAVLVNAAAYTAVDAAESHRDRAMRVNAEAVALLAAEMRALGGWLVHYSTDYVFDGHKAGPYTEEDLPAPLSVYGASKLAGEQAVTSSGCRHLVFRTSWVYGAHGANFAKTMLRLAQERTELKVVDDQLGAPTSAPLIAGATARVLQAVLGDVGFAPRATEFHHTGLYHLAAAGEVSWHGYASYLLQVARELGYPLTVAPGSVHPIHAASYPAVAKRPANSRLDTGKLCRTFGLTMPPWQEGVRELVSTLKAKESAREST